MASHDKLRLMKTLRIDKRMRYKLECSSKRLRKPIIRLIHENSDVPVDVKDLLTELGFTFYEDPLSYQYYFVSNVPLTYRWYITNQHHYTDKKLSSTELAELMESLREELDEMT